MPRLGIIGFERSGKTTLFNAVTGADHATGFATHTDTHVGIVKVADQRLDRLTAMHQPKKHTPADLEYVDFPGAGFGGRGTEQRFLGDLALMDALVHVVRAFDNDTVPHPQESVDPARDIEAMTLELGFADLALIEKRLERIDAESRSLKVSERDAAERETALLRRMEEALSDGVPVRDMPLSAEERVQIRHYRFLTDRPLLTLLNINEADAGEAEATAVAHRPAVEPPGAATAAACATLEMELRGLSNEDATAYREAVGAAEGVLDAAVRLSYQILGLHSFFTVGEDECRAWTVRVGDTALQAAGRIHSDIARGFIRAEVVQWQDLIDAGSEAEARKRAQLHMEGKDYVVQDGDVLHMLFNV